MSELLETVEIERGVPNRSIIWLHGLGANGHDFEPIVPSLGLDNVRFVFPHAPEKPVTVNAGMLMPSWYDIMTLSGPIRENLDHVRESAKRIEALIARESDRGIPVGKITLAGFSQGGALALYVGLRYPVALQGILVLSAYLLDSERIGEQATSANKDTPIFFAHGRHDLVVPFDGGRLSFETVAASGHAGPLDWNEYNMGHEVCTQEVRDIGSWLGGLA